MKKLLGYLGFIFIVIIVLLMVLILVETLTEPVARNDGMETIITAEMRAVYREGFNHALYAKYPKNPYDWDELAKRAAWFSGYMDYTEFYIIKEQNKSFNILLDEIRDPEAKRLILKKPCGVP